MKKLAWSGARRTAIALAATGSLFAVMSYSPAEAALAEAPQQTAQAAATSGGEFVSITPQRIFDTLIPIGTPVAGPWARPSRGSCS